MESQSPFVVSQYLKLPALLSSIEFRIQFTTSIFSKTQFGYFGSSFFGSLIHPLMYPSLSDDPPMAIPKVLRVILVFGLTTLGTCWKEDAELSPRRLPSVTDSNLNYYLLEGVQSPKNTTNHSWFAKLHINTTEQTNWDAYASTQILKRTVSLQETW